jgi:hypothetical protein
MTNNLPKVLEFTDLHLTENLKAIKETPSSSKSVGDEPLPFGGVYAIICYVTGAMYIGSSIDIGNRLVDHLVTNNTNGHLQSALNSYGLKNFTFCVVEFCDLEVLLQRGSPSPLRGWQLLRSEPPLTS